MASKPKPISIDGNNLFSNKVDILRFSLGRTGFRGHISRKIATARARITKLKRFKILGSKTKRHLYKFLGRSALEYPNIPMCIMAKENKDKLQKFQNGVTRRFIDNSPDKTIEDLHATYKIKPFNTHMYRRALRTWERFKEIDEETSRASITANENHVNNDHY